MVLDVGVALDFDLRRIGALPARRHFAVAAIKPLHRVHAGDHLADGREALLIQGLVVLQVDEQLGGAAVRPQVGVGQRALDVALLDGVVGQVGVGS